MKLFHVILAVLLLTGCASNEPVSPDVPVEQDKDKTPVVWETTKDISLTANEKAGLAEVNTFNDRLIDELAKQSQGDDYAVSPVSVAVYLGMLANSSDGEAVAGITSAMNTKDVDALNTLCTKLLRYLPSEATGSNMSISNRVWISKNYVAPDSYTSTMAKVFNAGVESVDFSKQSTLPAINKWVYDNTGGLIEYLVPDNLWQQYAHADMMSANTVYFQGKWFDEFDKSETRNGVFHGSEGNVEVPMMCGRFATYYAWNDVAEMFVLPFSGCVNRLEIYLPKGTLASVDIAARKDLNEGMVLYSLSVEMPRFTSENEPDLVNTLKTMGVDLSSMNLRGMGIDKDVCVNIMHKTMLKVDEKGAEMAAVTGGMGTSSGSSLPTATIKVDSPFMYIVRNVKTDAVIMAGTVNGSCLR